MPSPKIVATKNYSLFERSEDNRPVDIAKHRRAVRLYAAGTGFSHQDIAVILSVSVRTVKRYLEDIDRKMNEERDETIRTMWMACFTEQDIADAVGVTKETVSEKIRLCQILDNCHKSDKVSALHEDEPRTHPVAESSADTDKPNRRASTAWQT